MRKVWILFLGLTVTTGMYGLDLDLSPEDVRIEEVPDGGYVISVRAGGDIQSVMITESTEDPRRQVASFALRNPSYHPMNGDQRRILDGEFLGGPDGPHFIIDSDPEPDEEFGAAFRLFVPYVAEYGYPWSRRGEIQIMDGTYLNIRSFEKRYNDYTGAFQDNPFMLQVVQLPPPEDPLDLTGFREDTVESFSEIADETGGDLVPVEDPDSLTREIARLVEEENAITLDLVVVLDTTQSMLHTIEIVRKDLVPEIREILEAHERYRVGLVLFRDYLDEYLNKTFPFTEDFAIIQRSINAARAAGGRDIPEPVYEALHVALTDFEWEAENRVIVLIGDAPPHPRPRGSVTREDVYETARTLGVKIHTIALPHP
jgi:hypothetical protein